MSLDKHVKEHVDLGCSDRSTALGFAKMPEGYALMLDHDEAYFYWLRHDGVQSDIHWDRWAILKSAKRNDAWVKSQ